jgi:hypothetical protein
VFAQDGRKEVSMIRSRISLSDRGLTVVSSALRFRSYDRTDVGRDPQKITLY